MRVFTGAKRSAREGQIHAKSGLRRAMNAGFQSCSMMQACEVPATMLFRGAIGLSAPSQCAEFVPFGSSAPRAKKLNV